MGSSRLALAAVTSGDADKTSGIVVWIIAAILILAVIVILRAIIRRLRSR